jgi:microcystin degradation protein MlrC
MQRPFTVLTAEWQHETNTFCIVPTTAASFVERGWLVGPDAIAARGDANTELAGFLDAGRTHGWNLVHVLSAHAQPGGCVTQDAYEQIAAPILAAAREHRARLSGILLGLHGAMVAEACDDGEGELLRRLRAIVGPALPIAITLDPHANVSRAMCEHAQIIVSFKTYPHTDMRVAGRHAGDLLERTMRGEIAPRTLRVSRPMLEEANGGRTDIGPMIERLQSARAFEQQPDVFAVSINAGFANADIAEVGPTVLITAQGDLAQPLHFANELADDLWARRNERLNRYMTVTEAAARCKAYATASPAPQQPIVVADYADNPGGGAYGDSTNLLAALLEAGVGQACFGALFDPQTVQQLQACAPGQTLPVQLGGKTDARFGGGPLALDATLTALYDGHYVGSGAMIGGLARSWGPTAVIRVGGIEILVVSRRGQILDLQQFEAFGIRPQDQRVVALKSMQHFRAAFEPVAGEVIVCDSGALCTVDYSRLPFAAVPRPLHPFDADIDIEHWLRDNAQGVHLPGRVQ